MERLPDDKTRIAVLIPCFNEELTIADVVAGFRAALPAAEIHVFDNASTDHTSRNALAAGARVTISPIPGKGNVVRHMFEVVDADWYVMVDGDATYPAEAAPLLIAEAREKRIDMMVGRRVTPEDELPAAYRPMHQFGNSLVCGLIRKTFGSPIRDVFSGYRVFSREFVKTAPLHASGFQIEVEMTLQALSKGYPVAERDVTYRARPEGSVSKLNTYRDGLLVLASFVAISKDHRPALFFGVLAAILGFFSLVAGLAPILDYVFYQWVYHLPLAVLATGLAVLAALSLSIGVILQTQLVYHNEMHRLVRQGLPQ
ncbi:MAG: glycosyltransferase family 2 protein [Terrimicrobiaceae bacterium]